MGHHVPEHLSPKTFDDQTKKVNDQVTVGPQPAIADLMVLQKKGFKTVVNFRHDGEDHQPLTPASEGEHVEKLGMAYLHVPVSMKSITPKLVDQFRDEFRNVPKPVFAHCKLGTRAGLMVTMQSAIEHQMSGDEALRNAEQMGFRPDSIETRQFVKDYVDSRSHEAG